MCLAVTLCLVPSAAVAQIGGGAMAGNVIGQEAMYLFTGLVPGEYRDFSGLATLAPVRVALVWDSGLCNWP
jgi:hypothetical protein